MKRKLTAGQTSVSLPIFVQDTSSSTGGGLSGLTHGTSGLVAEYRRRGQSTWTAITLTSKTIGTWTSGGIVADGSLAGAYELDLPDAVCTSGARWVAVRLYGAANMLPCLIEIELDAFDYQMDVRGSCTVGTGSTTTSIVTSACSPAGAAADQFKGRVVIFSNTTTTTSLRGAAALISASSNSATPTLTVSTLPASPASGDTFIIA